MVGVFYSVVYFAFEMTGNMIKMVFYTKLRDEFGRYFFFFQITKMVIRHGHPKMLKRNDNFPDFYPYRYFK